MQLPLSLGVVWWEVSLWPPEERRAEEWAAGLWLAAEKPGVKRPAPAEESVQVLERFLALQ